MEFWKFSLLMLVFVDFIHVKLQADHEVCGDYIFDDGTHFTSIISLKVGENVSFFCRGCCTDLHKDRCWFLDGLPIESNNHNYNISGYVNDTSCSSSKLTFIVSSAFRPELTFYCEDRQNPNKSLLTVCYNNKASGIIVIRVIGSSSLTSEYTSNISMITRTSMLISSTRIMPSSTIDIDSSKLQCSSLHSGSHQFESASIYVSRISNVQLPNVQRCSPYAGALGALSAFFMLIIVILFIGFLIFTRQKHIKKSHSVDNENGSNVVMNNIMIDSTDNL